MEISFASFLASVLPSKLAMSSGSRIVNVPPRLGTPGGPAEAFPDGSAFPRPQAARASPAPPTAAVPIICRRLSRCPNREVDVLSVISRPPPPLRTPELNHVSHADFAPAPLQVSEAVCCLHAT